MDDSKLPPLAEQDPTLLFEEYLAALEAGESVDLEDLARRAGRREPELRRRMQVYGALQELSDTLQPLPGGGDEPDGHPPVEEAQMHELGRFRNLVQIGHGGSSRVLLAHDPKLARRVALKVFSPREIGVRDARAWMQNEGRSLARLEHSGVVRVFDLDEADGHAYIEMEYVQGPSLRDVLEHMRTHAPSSDSDLDKEADADSGGTDGAFRSDASMDAWTRASARALDGLPARVRFASKLARALHYCHEQDVIHRDIKPGNILLVHTCEPKLIDFGLAHSASEEESLNQVTQRLVGTPAYLAPEQVDGSRTGASPKSDQFSLGTVIYELLTLENPFQEATRDDTLRSISRADPRPLRKADPAIPTDLERIVLHCLERSSKDRYPSVGALADDLDAFLDLRAISLQPPSPAKLVRLWIARNRRDVLLAAGAVLCVVASIVALWVLDARSRRGTLSDELRAQALRVEQLENPMDFQAAYPVLFGLERTARDLDREAVSSIVGRDLESRAHALIRACSRRLAENLALEWKGLEKADEFHRRDETRKIMTSWGSVLGMDLSYCPECPDNVRDRERGRVDLPSVAPGQSIRLMKYVPGNGPMLSSLTPISFKSGLAPGLYRFQLIDSAGALLREADFETSATELRHTLEVHDLRPEIRRAMVHLEKTSRKIGPSTIDAGPLWIMRAPLRWRDLKLVLTPAMVAWLEGKADNATGSSSTADDPAILTYQAAQDFARAAGARIPKVEELLAAWQDPEAAPHEAEQHAAGELATSPVLFNDRPAVGYAALGPGGTISMSAIVFMSDFGALIKGKARDGKPAYYTFRLAWSDLR